MIRHGLLALAVLGMSACGGAAQESAPRGEGGAAVPVTTTTVAPRQWNDTVAALGTVNARESITVTAKVSEIVQRVHFDSGDEVAAGAVLVTLAVGYARTSGLIVGLWAAGGVAVAVWLRTSRA